MKNPKIKTRFFGFFRLSAVAATLVFAFSLFIAAPAPAKNGENQAEAVDDNAQGKTQSIRARWGNPARRGEIDQVVLPPAVNKAYFVSPAAEGEEDGSESRPWKNVSKAFRSLGPGDRLVLMPGTYGPIMVGQGCADGQTDMPIEVLARVNAVITGKDETPSVEVRKAHWHFYGLEISPGKARGAAFMTYGTGARHILLDRSHLHDGLGDGVVVGPHSRDITIANSHIHRFGHPDKAPDAYGIRILPGVRDIRITGNKIHTNFAGPYTVVGPERHPGDREGNPLDAADGIVFKDNKMKKNW
ncbi:MAG: hypothetical protein JRF65_08550 [Deltaproteobacteria bacterium]|nr:hypothetical protein [Deltaproteobacteria bacterium]